MLNQAKLPAIKIKGKALVSHYFIASVRQDFQFLKELGQGSQGIVFLARNKITQDLRAIKVISKAILNENFETIENEIKILSQLDHPNIIKLYEVYESESNIYLVLEYCEGGDLLELISFKKKLSEDQARTIMKQLFHVVAYCHSKNICHRDLKPENFLLKNKNDITLIKLTDFGISKKLVDNEFMTEPYGTPYYLAPEIIAGKYGYEIDNWALGVILYIMICGHPPFDGNNTQNIILAIKNRKMLNSQNYSRCSNQVKKLIDSLLNIEISKRCNSQQAYFHSWFQRTTNYGTNQVQKIIQAKEEKLNISNQSLRYSVFFFNFFFYKI